MSRWTKKNCPMVGVSADCDLKDCPYRTEADQNKDTIYREDAIKATWQEPTYTDPLNVLTEVRDRIEAIPSVDIPHSDDWEKYSDKLWKNAYERGKADRPQGKWFKDDEGTFICSACGSGYKDQPTCMGRPMFEYCPMCGAKINADRKDEPQTMVYPQVDGITPSVIEPQTETEIAKAIVHKMIDDAVIAEDAYPDLRQKMHDAVDEYEPQTDCAWR